MSTIAIHRRTTRLRGMLAGLAAAAGMVGVTVSTTSAQAAPAPVVDVRPAQLERGPDAAIPHVEGRTFVDGERRVGFPTDYVRLVGRSGDSFILAGDPGDGSRNYVVWRLLPDDTRQVIARRVDSWTLVLSEDGSELVETREHFRSKTTDVRVRSAMDGTVTDVMTFGGYPRVLAAEAGRVLVSREHRTVWWEHDAEEPRLTTLVRRPSVLADLGADRLASLTGDPYRGGCAVVSSVSRPRTEIGRSCRQAPIAFSPDGTRMATSFILSDGPGPGEVQLREADFTGLATYRSRWWFGDVQFESPEHLLLTTRTRRTERIVRCAGADCEVASDPRPAQPMRTATDG